MVTVVVVVVVVVVFGVRCAAAALPNGSAVRILGALQGRSLAMVVTDGAFAGSSVLRLAY